MKEIIITLFLTLVEDSRHKRCQEASQPTEHHVELLNIHIC